MTDTGSTHPERDDDNAVLRHIDELVAEEKRLRATHQAAHEGLGETDGARLRAIEQELDQYWDLLRQRRAAGEFGTDPDASAPRPVGEVEGYQQ